MALARGGGGDERLKFPETIVSKYFRAIFPLALLLCTDYAPGIYFLALIFPMNQFSAASAYFQTFVHNYMLKILLKLYIFVYFCFSYLPLRRHVSLQSADLAKCTQPVSLQSQRSTPHQLRRKLDLP